MVNRKWVIVWSEMPLWTDVKVGKIGEIFPTFILEAPRLKTSLRNNEF